MTEVTGVHRSLAVVVFLIAACTASSPTSTVLTPSASTESTVTPSHVAPPSATSGQPVATPSSGASTAHGWRPVPTQDVVLAAQWDRVVWTGDRFVASDEIGGTAIESVDAIRWAEAAYPSVRIPAGIPDRAVDAALGVTGWVAVGGQWEPGPCASWCPPLRGLVWTSSDGQHWTAVPPQRSLAKAQLDAIADWQGGYVAVGDLYGQAATWWSTDGRSWDRRWKTTREDGLSGFTSLEVVDGTLVAAGTLSAQDLIQEPIVVWSKDGRNWHLATVEAADQSQIFTLGVAPGELLAAGPSSGCVGGIWSSADGKTLVCQGDQSMEAFAAYAAAGSPNIEVVVGFGNPGGTEELYLGGAIWWRPVID